MNEEEILKEIERIIFFTTNSGLCCEKEEGQAIQGLLDLYKQEKEKNKNLILGKFREVADKNSYIKDNYISKDKIREKLDYQYELWNTPNKQKEYSQDIVNILEELLEEK